MNQSLRAAETEFVKSTGKPYFPVLAQPRYFPKQQQAFKSRTASFSCPSIHPVSTRPKRPYFEYCLCHAYCQQLARTTASFRDPTASSPLFMCSEHPEQQPRSLTAVRNSCNEFPQQHRAGLSVFIRNPVLNLHQNEQVCVLFASQSRKRVYISRDRFSPRFLLYKSNVFSLLNNISQSKMQKNSLYTYNVSREGRNHSSAGEASSKPRNFYVSASLVYIFSRGE